MEKNSIKNLEELKSQKPQRLVQEAPPEIREYICALEGLLSGAEKIEALYNGVCQKYLDVQEDLCASRLQMVEHNYKINELTQENNKLRAEIERLNKATAKPNKNIIATPKVIAPACPIREATERSNNIGIDPNENNANSVLVKGVPQELFDPDPKKGIISLGQLMNLQIRETDIRKITAKERKFYERQNMQPDKLIFIVELSNSDTKVNILKNKEKLKLHAKTKDIEISDYVSEEVYNLCQYAKVLKSCGYHSVYWRNNSVYAKKTRSSNSQPILIESANQVDVLKEIKLI